MFATVECHNCPGAAHEFFSCLLPGQQSRLSVAAVPHAYRPHESVYHEGTPALAVHCIRSGTIKLFRRLRHGEEVVVGVRGPGDLVGLRGVLAGVPYANTAMTLEHARVCAIPGDVFLGLVRENPMMGFRLLTRLAAESRQMERQLVERAHTRVAKRIARFLAAQFEGDARAISPPAGGTISMSREEMAHLIGTTPESLSRALHGLAADGVIELARKEIRVLDLPALHRLAE